MTALVKTAQAEHALRRPLGVGQPVTYWRLGATGNARYDVPDQPMKGEMDPFFFLTKHKNFIPHEYPCRTQFAAERRGKRPQVTLEAQMDRVWLPFASPRVDLSGFWFRPTVIGTWAETSMEAQSSGPARLRLRTCGGAILVVNGEEAGWMAPYGRNLETAEEFEVALQAGRNDIRIWFDDLAERDARYYFQLDYLAGPAVSHALPIPVDADTAETLEAALDSMRFEHATYDSQEVALVSDVAMPGETNATVVIEGDFMSIEQPVRFDLTLRQGTTRLAIAGANDLPADFRHFKVTLDIGGYAVSRVFGVEIAHATRQGPAPGDLVARIDEALDEVSERAEMDTVCALARLATGRAGHKTDAMIAASLEAIEDCHDCADFILVPLLWSRAKYADKLDAAVVARIDAAMLGYRYWMDERGNDVQWYFSENHALLFHTAAYLAGHILPEGRFVRSGRTGKEQSAVGGERVHAWLDHFEKWEMAEFNSAPYFPIDLKGLCALYALAPDADISERAGKAIVRLLGVVARSAHHGQITGAQGRSYEHTLRASRSLELSGICRMVWGKGNFGMRFHALPQLALCFRDHGLSIPADLAGVAAVEGDQHWEWTFAQGQDRFARLYHFKTRDYAMGTAAAYRWNQWGYQETVIQIRLGRNPDAQIWINHPGEVLQSGYGRPSYWGGSGTLPRVHQYRGLAVVVFDCFAEQPDFTHAWFPRDMFTTSRLDGTTAFAEADDAFALIKASGPLELVTTGPTAGNELRVAGHKATWIVRLGDRATAGSLDAFASRFGSISVSEQADGALVVNDPDYGQVVFAADGSATAEGRKVDPATWSIEGQAVLLN
jgi:hypothetical protein